MFAPFVASLAVRQKVLLVMLVATRAKPHVTTRLAHNEDAKSRRRPSAAVTVRRAPVLPIGIVPVRSLVVRALQCPRRRCVPISLPRTVLRATMIWMTISIRRGFRTRLSRPSTSVLFKTPAARRVGGGSAAAAAASVPAAAHRHPGPRRAMVPASLIRCRHRSATSVVRHSIARANEAAADKARADKVVAEAVAVEATGEAALAAVAGVTVAAAVADADADSASPTVEFKAFLRHLPTGINPMAIERTLSIIKPDAVAKNVIGQIYSRFEAAGLKVIAARMAHLSRGEAEAFYAVHKARPFFKDLVDFMISGPVMIQALEGENAIAKNRDLMGATDPKKADKGTIRADFADSIDANAVHGSDAADTAAQEIAFFFAGANVYSR